jgi:hypothetical protein
LVEGRPCFWTIEKIDDDPSRYTALVLRFWRLDAEQRADEQKGRPPALRETMRFAAIGLDAQCLWQRSHRLGKVAARVGALPQIGFHALPQQAWNTPGVSPDTHCCDPILDLTLVNDSTRLSVLSSIGFVAHAVWSDLKGLKQPYKVHVTDGYVLQCEAIAAEVPQVLDLTDPLAIPGGQPLESNSSSPDSERAYAETNPFCGCLRWSTAMYIGHA